MDTENNRRRRKKSPKAFRRHSPAERASLLATFEAALAEGCSHKIAVRNLGVSLASLQRWRRHSKPDALFSPPPTTKGLSIAAAIDRLCDLGNSNRFLLLEALFKLIVWMRFPSEPRDHPAAMTVCMMSYLSYGRTSQTLDQLPPEMVTMLLRHLRVDTLKRLCSNETFYLPVFDLWDILGQPYKETDYFADIVNYLLAYEPESTGYRDRASLNKAHSASQNGYFRYKWPISMSTFRAYWHLYGSSSPFLFTRCYNTSLEIPLDPNDDTFFESVNTIVTSRDELIHFLARSRAVAEKLSSLLDRRALIQLNFPTFPESLKPENYHPSPLPDSTTRKKRIAKRLIY